MEPVKSFFKMTKYEFIRVARNKVVATMLILFTVIVLLFLSLVKLDLKSYAIALYTDGITLEELAMTNTMFEDTKDNKFINVNSIEEGKALVRKGTATFFIALNSKTDPVSATLYYDESSSFGRTVEGRMKNKSNEYAYEKIKEYMAEWGVKIDEDYFNLIKFESTSPNEISAKQVPFALEVATCITIVLTFGLAYSLARDNETNVSKNVSYMPIGHNRYLFSKVLVYFILGMAEMLVALLVGRWCFKIDYQINMFLILLLAAVFVLSTIMLGMLFAMMRSQISTTLCNMIVLILPLFALSMTHIQTFPVVLQILLYCCPTTPFVQFLNGTMFNGIVHWSSLVILVLQSIVFYATTLLVLKKKSKR